MVGDKEIDDPGAIITLDEVKGFLEDNKGKVKQTALVNHFRHQLSGVATKGQARQDFKDILQLITAVKTENGEKYIVLIKQNNQDHSQTLVALRKGSRTLEKRKELAKSKYDFLGTATPPSQSDDEDTIPHHGSASTLSSQGHDSGIHSDASSMQSSVASLRTALSSKIKGTQSMDSINTFMTDETDGDLEDDLGLNDGLEVLPEEKDWMLAAAYGKIDILKKLIEKYPSLATKKDFVMGYTALHWAAKLGRPDIVKFITSAGADVTSKSHGGYTPLHLAAMTGKDQVIIMLIELYGASIHARDNGGKKPKDVVKETVAPDVQRKLGRSLILEPAWVMTDAIIERRLSIAQSAIIVAAPSPRNRRISKPRIESVTSY